MYHYRNILALLAILFCCNCQLFAEKMPASWNWGAKSRPLTGVRGFPEADTDYGKGFKDGCAASFKAVSKGYLTDATPMIIDPKKIGTPDYSTGYEDGSEQCTYILDWDVV